MTSKDGKNPENKVEKKENNNIAERDDDRIPPKKRYERLFDTKADNEKHKKIADVNSKAVKGKEGLRSSDRATKEPKEIPLRKEKPTKEKNFL